MADNNPERRKYLKACLTASNALKQASDDTVDVCFDDIVSNLFGSKRDLIKYLMTPQRFEKQAIVIGQIKQIFDNVLQQLMEAQSGDYNVADALTISLANISENVQMHIVSFLDFESMKQLKNVCSSLASIAIDESFKMDLEICNAHQMMNENPLLSPYEIITANIRTYRVHASASFQVFLDSETSVPSDEVLCLHVPSMGITKYVRLWYGMSVGDLFTVSCSKGAKGVLLLMDRTKVNAIILQRYSRETTLPLRLVQEFDVRRQTLSIKHVLPSNSNLDPLDIKEMIMKETGKDINLYYSEGDRLIEVFANVVETDKLCSFFSMLYEIKKTVSESESDALESEHLEPFLSVVDFNDSHVKGKGTLIIKVYCKDGINVCPHW